MVRTIIDINNADVVDGGSHYREVGADINHYDETVGALVQTAPIFKPADPDDSCSYKTGGTKYKCGFSNTDWHFGFKHRETGNQYKTKFVFLVGIVETPDYFRYDILETLDPNAAIDPDTRTFQVTPSCKLSTDLINSGSTATHTLSASLPQKYPQYTHFGAQWGINDLDGYNHIEIDRNCKLHRNDSDNTFFEYVPVSAFQILDNENNVIGYQDVTHDYTTINGTQTVDTTFTAGTYYVSANYYTGNYFLKFDCSGGNIFMKFAYSADIEHSGTAVCQQINSSATNKLYFVPYNDDAHGQQIAGSDHTPVSGSHVNDYLYTSGSGDCTMKYWEMWYFSSSYGGMTFNGLNTSKNINWSYGIVKYGVVTAEYTGMVGAYGNNVLTSTLVGSCTFDNIVIDSTNTINNVSSGCLWPVGVTVSVTNCSVINPTLGAPAATLWIQCNDSYSQTATIKNNHFITATGNNITVYGHSNTFTVNLLENTLTCATPLAGGYAGFYFDRSGGTFVANVTNNNIVNCNGNAASYGGFATGTMTFTDNYNNYYGNSHNNTGYSKGANDVAVNPSFVTIGSLSTAYTIDPACTLVDGYFINPASALIHAGSDTYANLGIDNTKYSNTDALYLSTDKVNIGVLYWLDYTPPGGSPIFESGIMRGVKSSTSRILQGMR